MRSGSTPAVLKAAAAWATSASMLRRGMLSAMLAQTMIALVSIIKLFSSIIKFSGILKSVHLSSVIHQIQGKGGCYTGATR